MTYRNLIEKIKTNYNYQFIIFLIAHIIVWTIVPLLVAHRIGVDMAEHFYWGQEFQLGYYKHPPFSAWLVGIWFKIFPANHFFYFLFCQINIAIGFIFIYRLAKEILKDDKKAFIATTILEFVSFYSYKSIFFRGMCCFNHDYILLSIWPICAYYFYLTLKEDHLKNWILFGIFAGISMLSKYFSAIFLASLFLVFLSHYHKNFFKKILSFNVLLSMALFFLVIS
ncbi:MAG: glycosyltransferase family 39 protein, partial [Proteobacteria bacterium]|nr:glycosyltransferase family 39 protein [Pseudomonadota bacterium]